jgi:type IV pilus assembly protein PilB
MARRLGTVLVDLGYLDEDKLWKVLEEQKRSPSELLGRVAVRLNLVTEDQVMKALGEQLGMKVVKLGDITISPEAVELVNETMAQAFKVVSLRTRPRSTVCGHSWGWKSKE